MAERTHSYGGRRCTIANVFLKYKLAEQKQITGLLIRARLGPGAQRGKYGELCAFGSLELSETRRGFRAQMN